MKPADKLRPFVEYLKSHGIYFELDTKKELQVPNYEISGGLVDMAFIQTDHNLVSIYTQYDVFVDKQHFSDVVQYFKAMEAASAIDAGSICPCCSRLTFTSTVIISTPNIDPDQIKKILDYASSHYRLNATDVSEINDGTITVSVAIQRRFNP
jgi:hypothetical protein